MCELEGADFSVQQSYAPEETDEPGENHRPSPYYSHIYDRIKGFNIKNVNPSFKFQNDKAESGIILYLTFGNLF